MALLWTTLLTVALAGAADAGVHSGDAPPELVSFETPDRGRIYGNLYGDGTRAVVLAHGARFNKESWDLQARALAKAGFWVLALDLRGRGQSRGPKPGEPEWDAYRFDVLGAVRYLRGRGATSVSVVGASLGGGAAANAVVDAKPGEIDRLVLLAHASIEKPEKLKGRKLFIATRGDSAGAEKAPRLPKLRAQFDRAPEPKELVVLEGEAHAQNIFQTDQGERLMHEILRFLSAP